MLDWSREVFLDLIFLANSERASASLEHFTNWKSPPAKEPFHDLRLWLMRPHSK
jgi:hypothetical protein